MKSEHDVNEYLAGSYSEWIADHPDMLSNVIPLVISGLSNPDVSPSATMALKDITQNCQKYLQPYGDVIIIACQVSFESTIDNNNK